MRNRRTLGWAGLVDYGPTTSTAPACAKHVTRQGRWDEVKLWQLGYKQEFKRTLDCLSNAACSISILSIWPASELYVTQGLAYGGPVVVMWGWVLVSCFSMAIALSTAELVSAFPTSGGYYYWSFMLAPHKHRRLACWMTGWMHVLSQWTSAAFLELGLANFIATMVWLHTLGPSEQPGYIMSSQELLAVFAGLLALHAWLNCLGPRVTRALLVFGAAWALVATPALCATLLWVAPSHQSTPFVLTKWLPGTAASGVTSPPYIVLMGLLMSQWTLLGYDSCVHLCEETKDAGISVSWALVGSVGLSCALGLLTLLSLTFSLQSLDNLYSEEVATVGMAQVIWDVFKARYGMGHGALGPMYILLVAMFMCSYASITNCGRSVYAYSRDGAMLGSRYWRLLSKQGGQPVAGTWFMVSLAFLMGLPAVFVPQVWASLSAAGVVSIFLSFSIPLGLRCYQGSSSFIPGPFHLGRWGRPLAACCCGWMLLMCATFCLPMVYPVTLLNANWAPLIVVVMVAFALGLWWAPRIGGTHWFHGPSPNVNAFRPEDAVVQGRPSHAPVDVPTITMALGSLGQRSLTRNTPQLFWRTSAIRATPESSQRSLHAASQTLPGPSAVPRQGEQPGADSSTPWPTHLPALYDLSWLASTHPANAAVETVASYLGSATSSPASQHHLQEEGCSPAPDWPGVGSMQPLKGLTHQRGGEKVEGSAQHTEDVRAEVKSPGPRAINQAVRLPGQACTQPQLLSHSPAPTPNYRRQSSLLNHVRGLLEGLAQSGGGRLASSSSGSKASLGGVVPPGSQEGLQPSTITPPLAATPSRHSMPQSHVRHTAQGQDARSVMADTALWGVTPGTPVLLTPALTASHSSSSLGGEAPPDPLGWVRHWWQEEELAGGEEEQEEQDDQQTALLGLMADPLGTTSQVSPPQPAPRLPGG